ncbi:MAG: hypothetical protein JWR42_2084 [Marmoricola sp.]|nr:hypothetical protein [Marmoricola sp.]
MSHPLPSQAPILVEVDVSKSSRDALDEAVRRSLVGAA